MDKDVVRELIRAHEGVRTKAYYDSLGILTVGIGFNLETNSAPTRISSIGVDYTQLCGGKCELTEDHVKALFSVDLDDAILAAQTIVKNFDEHPDDVQHVIIDMIFNLGGPRFAKFKKTIKAFEEKNYRLAAAEMGTSKWAEQVPNRANEDIGLVLKHAEEIS